MVKRSYFDIFSVATWYRPCSSGISVMSLRITSARKFVVTPEYRINDSNLNFSIEHQEYYGYEGYVLSLTREQISIFHEKNGYGVEILYVNTIYFNDDTTNATVDAMIYVAPLAGGGYEFYLEKQEGTWKLLSREMTWIS